jgi:hypothetical protein
MMGDLFLRMSEKFHDVLRGLPAKAKRNVE